MVDSGGSATTTGRPGWTLAGIAGAASLVVRRLAGQQTLVPSLDRGVDGLLVALRLNPLVGAVPAELASAVIWVLVLAAFHRALRRFLAEAGGVLLADRVVMALTSLAALTSAASTARFFDRSLAAGGDAAGTAFRALVVDHALLAVAGVAALSWYLTRTYGRPYVEDSELRGLLVALYPGEGDPDRRRTLRATEGGGPAVVVGRLTAVVYLPVVLLVVSFGLGTVGSLVGLLSPVPELLVVAAAVGRSLPTGRLPDGLPGAGTEDARPEPPTLADVEETALTAVGSVLRNPKGQMVVFPFVVLLSFPAATFAATAGVLAATLGEAASALGASASGSGLVVPTARLLGATALQFAAGILSLWVLLRLARRLPGFLRAWSGESTDAPTVRRPPGILAVPVVLYVLGTLGVTWVPGSGLAWAYAATWPLVLLGAVGWAVRTWRGDFTDVQSYPTDDRALPVALAQTWVGLTLAELLAERGPATVLADPTWLPREFVTLGGVLLVLTGIYFSPDLQRRVDDGRWDYADVALAGGVIVLTLGITVWVEALPAVTAVFAAGVAVAAVLLVTEARLR